MKSGYFSYVCHPDLFLNHLQEITPRIDRLLDEIIFNAKELDIPLEININGETNNKFGAIAHGCYHYPSIYFFQKILH